MTHLSESVACIYAYIISWVKYIFEVLAQKVNFSFTVLMRQHLFWNHSLIFCYCVCRLELMCFSPIKTFFYSSSNNRWISNEIILNIQKLVINMTHVSCFFFFLKVLLKKQSTKMWFIACVYTLYIFTSRHKIGGSEKVLKENNWGFT